MNISRKIAHKAQAVKGSCKKTASRLTASRHPRAEGRAGQANSNLRQAGAKIKDALTR
jgi:uncharacterized protein YjbJ (UPF0337 family)